VDEDDLLIGRTDRDLSIKKADTLFTLRTAALVVREGKFLAAKSEDYDVYYTVGGGVEIGESTEETVIREVYEETGYRLEIERLAFVHERFAVLNNQRCHQLGFFYLMKDNPDFVVAENTRTDQKKETLHWLPLNGLRGINLVPAFLRTKSFDNITAIEHIVSREY